MRTLGQRAGLGALLMVVALGAAACGGGDGGGAGSAVGGSGEFEDGDTAQLEAVTAIDAVVTLGHRHVRLVSETRE